MWELNPPTELTRFLHLPNRVRTDKFQNYSLDAIPTELLAGPIEY